MSNKSPVEVIAEVIGGHGFSKTLNGGVLGWRYRCRCGDVSSDYQAHVAAEVDKALGGLTREVSQATRNCSYPGSDGPCVGKWHGRWVSGWTPEVAS